jgi:acylphosphatase
MIADQLKHYNITISGRVQGVGFRFAAKKTAISLGIKGSIKNLYNGDVYIEAEGLSLSLNKFVDWCFKGPVYADVKNVFTEEAELKGFKYVDIVG